MGTVAIRAEGVTIHQQGKDWRPREVFGDVELDPGVEDTIEILPGQVAHVSEDEAIRILTHPGWGGSLVDPDHAPQRVIDAIKARDEELACTHPPGSPPPLQPTVIHHGRVEDGEKQQRDLPPGLAGMHAIK
jgi:hypothetical protein